MHSGLFMFLHYTSYSIIGLSIGIVSTVSCEVVFLLRDNLKFSSKTGFCLNYTASLQN